MFKKGFFKIKLFLAHQQRQIYLWFPFLLLVGGRGDSQRGIFALHFPHLFRTSASVGTSKFSPTYKFTYKSVANVRKGTPQVPPISMLEPFSFYVVSHS